MRFLNRDDAGRQLAQKLAVYRGFPSVVLGLPRGGLAVAKPVAEALGAPLDVLVVRKLGAPDQPEFAIGAVTARGTRVLYGAALRHLSLPPGYLERITRVESENAARRAESLRGFRPVAPLRDRIALLVDDGVATGMTMAAAIEDARAARPRAVVVAAPVMSQDAYEMLAKQADEVVTLAVPGDFQAVGQFYEDFAQVSDDEVKALLASVVH